MVPISGDYLRIKNSATAPTDVAGYSTVKTNASGVPVFRTAAGVEYAVNPSGPNTITVGVLGDYTTIAAAIVAAAARTPSVSNRIAILVYPGVYAEQSLELPDYVDLVGVSREGCIISKASTYWDGVTNPSTALLFVPFNSTVANLTVFNTVTGVHIDGDGNYGAAIATGFRLVAGAASYSTYGTQRIQNCTIKANADFALTMLGVCDAEASDCAITASRWALQMTAKASQIKRVSLCQITSTRTNSTDESPLWAGEVGTLVFDQCWLKATDATEGGVFVDEQGTNGLHLFFNHCVFTSGAANAPGPVMTANAKAGALDVNIYLRNCSYSLKGSADPVITWHDENMGDGAKTMGGNLQVDGATGVTAANGFVVNANTKLESGSLTLGSGVILYPDGTYVATDNPLKSTDSITAATGLSCTLTQWRDFNAVACAQGNVNGYGTADLAPQDYNLTAWAPNTLTGSTHLTTLATGSSCYFPVPYGPGSIVTKIRCKWQAVGANDGVKFRLVKRDESGTATALTLVGAQQTATDAGAPFDVTVTEYTLAAAETLAANTSYMVEVESVKATTQVNLYSVGIETSKRVY